MGVAFYWVGYSYKNMSLDMKIGEEVGDLPITSDLSLLLDIDNLLNSPGLSE